MMTSWAPTPSILSYKPSALRVSAPSTRKNGNLFGDDAKAPAGFVCRSTSSISQNLRRRPQFIARTEGTKANSLDFHLLPAEIARALGAVGGDNNPSTGYRIFSKLWHPSAWESSIITEQLNAFRM